MFEDKTYSFAPPTDGVLNARVIITYESKLIKVNYSTTITRRNRNSHRKCSPPHLSSAKVRNVIVITVVGDIVTGHSTPST